MIKKQIIGTVLFLSLVVANISLAEVVDYDTAEKVVNALLTDISNTAASEIANHPEVEKCGMGSGHGNILKYCEKGRKSALENVLNVCF